MRRMRPAVASALLVVIAATAACSGSSGRADPATASTRATEADAGDLTGDDFPVTIEHMLGEAVIPERPERVVALGPADVDIALALGVTPVAVTESPALGGGLAPWVEGHFDLTGVEVWPADLTGAPAERLLTVDPDVVLGTTATADADDYEAVARLEVPTLGPLTGPSQDAWDDLTLTIGRALGRSTEATEVVADVQGQIDDLAADLPGLEGKTFVIAAANGPGVVRVVNRPTDIAARLFYELGMTLPEALTGLDNDTPVGAIDISLEQVDLLDADVIFMADTGDLHRQVTELPAFATLPAVEQGGLLVYDPAVASGLRVPTPLSIPYLLEVVRPTLEGVSAGPTPRDG